MNVGRAIFREFETDERRKNVFYRLQREAASRPESKLVQTPYGQLWMSPIEFTLYEAMLKEGLDPVPQACIEGYFVDFAFLDVNLAVEADGAVHHDELHRQRDRKRDWILRNAGWDVMRFRGTTIYNKAGNCAYIVKREVKTRRDWAVAQARERERRKQARREAILGPFRKIARFLTRGRKG